MAYLTATILRRDDIPETIGVPLLAAVVSGIVANIQLGVIPGPPGTAQNSASGYVSMIAGNPQIAGQDPTPAIVTILFALGGFFAIRRRTQASVDKGIKTFLVVLGAIVAFSSGGSQVGLATGPLQNLFVEELQLDVLILLSIGALGILAGAWMGAPRLLQATSREYAQLGTRRSIAALVPGFIIAQVAIALGIPISFNNIIISGVIGGGLAAGSAGVSRRKIGVTVTFWILTLATSVIIGYGVYTAFSTVLPGQ
jgi:phosphate/sulfate permease